MATKLQEWVFVFTVFSAIYLSVVLDLVQFNLSSQAKFLFQISPILIIAAFGVYSAITILYRVATFNNCEEAAEELKQQIDEARKDLKQKGFKFD